MDPCTNGLDYCKITRGRGEAVIMTIQQRLRLDVSLQFINFCYVKARSGLMVNTLSSCR